MPHPHHPDHHHRKRHRHHHHHDHSGTTPNAEAFGVPDCDTINNDQRSYHYHDHDAPAAAPPTASQKPWRIGVAIAIQHILDAVNALPDQRTRHFAVGAAISRLSEQGRVKGISDVVQVAMNETNHYLHLGDDDSYERTTTHYGYK